MRWEEGGEERKVEGEGGIADADTDAEDVDVDVVGTDVDEEPELEVEVEDEGKPARECAGVVVGTALREMDAMNPARSKTERTPKCARVCATATCACRARKAFWTRAQRSYGSDVDRAGGGGAVSAETDVPDVGEPGISFGDMGSVDGVGWLSGLGEKLLACSSTSWALSY